MSTIFNFISAGARHFIQFLFSHFLFLLRNLSRAKSDIQLRYLMSDLLSVLRSAGMFTFLNLVAFIVFAFFPQGKDVLLIIAEDINNYQFGNLFCLLCGVLFWSIASEYGTRYSIYVTDNTALSISDKRVVWRKAVQRTVADFFLMVPYAIVLLGFLINYLQDQSLKPSERNIGFGTPALCLYLLFKVVARFYYKDHDRNPAGINTSFRKLMILPQVEYDWCTKLFGIYNRYLFTLRKPSNFNPGVRNQYEVFCEQFLNVPQEVYDPATGKTNFPQDPEYMDSKSLVPPSFVLKEFTTDGQFTNHDNEAGQYKWSYSIPLNFYKVLHLQLKILVLSSLVIFVIICLLPVNAYVLIGAPGLIVIAFGCWCGIYTGLLYMDYAKLRSYKLSLRFVLLLLLVWSSFVNNDHPVRFNTNGALADKRPPIDQHFTNWVHDYEKDSLNTLYSLRSKPGEEEFYPVVFVCAEGGALRTGAFAALALSFLRDSIRHHYGIDVRNSMYALSGVSGGSLGLSFFNAMAYLTDSTDLKPNRSYSQLATTFFNEDYLAPVIGKMFYSDLIQLFIPLHLECLDRAIALEKAWEGGFEKILKMNSRNTFSADFRHLYAKRTGQYPALFINTTEAESGMQCWITNVVMPKDSIPFAAKRDLLAYKIRGGINYSTSINFSSRFPLFSPAGALSQDDGKKFHYVDGGYVENTGAGTMLDVLKALKPTIDSLAKDSLNGIRQRPIRIKPFVLVLQYDLYNNGTPANINLGNELVEVLVSMYNTRIGRSQIAIADLTQYTHRLGGEVFVLPLEKSGSEVPMNWVLSKKSLDKIKDDIVNKWEKRDKEELRGFFAIDTNYLSKRRLYEIRKADSIKNAAENRPGQPPVRIGG